MAKIAMVGNPNVGKSSVLNRISGSHIFASNYAGTSVEIIRSSLKAGKRNYEIYDTPGVYSIFSDNEESKVSRGLLEDEKIDLVLNVIDASNLERNLVLSHEIIELGYPVIIILNQIDRVRKLGITVDIEELSRLMACPVVAFSATSGEGIMELTEILQKASWHKKTAEDRTTDKPDIISLDNIGCGGNCARCSNYIPVEKSMTEDDLRRAKAAQEIAQAVSSSNKGAQKLWLKKVEHFMDRPILGTLALLIFAYMGFWILLKFIELSEGPITALMEPVAGFIGKMIYTVFPASFFTTVIAKAVPEGLIIPFTIIMPAMFMVSVLMAVLEDTGLLPRYSVALERIGSVFGLSGQAIIPLSLGFGCRTPAIVATRIMPNDTQRFITITLLSIVIPCAATLGIMAMVISTFQASLAVLMITMIVTMLALGSILSRIMPQENVFIYELPPLRIPIRSNVWNKVKIRFSGFFKEVLPLLLIMSIVIRALMESGILEHLGALEEFTIALFGIPAEAFIAVLVTIFQRYLAPLVLLNLSLSSREATIAISMIALSMPCLPVMVMTVREMGYKSLFKILGMAFLTTFTVGILLNIILPV